MKNRSILAMCVAATLCGCGGGGGGSSTPPPTAEVPASASTSVPNFIAYIQALIVAAADMLEPVDVSKVTPPTDETSEPVTVN